MKLFHRPQENQQLMIHKFGRFDRIIDANDGPWWDLPAWFVIPIIEAINGTIDTSIRVADLYICKLLSMDEIPIDLDVKVFFYIDLRSVENQKFMVRAPYLERVAWEQIIQTNVIDILANKVLPKMSAKSIFSESGRARITNFLGHALSERAVRLGIHVNPRSVSLQNMAVNSDFAKTYIKGISAKISGQAARDRLEPFQDLLVNSPNALALMMASVLAESEELPNILVDTLMPFYRTSTGTIDGLGELRRKAP